MSFMWPKPVLTLQLICQSTKHQDSCFYAHILGFFCFVFFPSVSILLNHLFSSFFSSNCTIQFVSEIVSLSNSLGANFEQSKLLLKTKVANADKLLCPFHINSCYKDCRSMTCDSSFLVPIFFPIIPQTFFITIQKHPFLRISCCRIITI